MRDGNEIRSALAGPVASVRTPFTADGGIDEAGLRAYVERAIAADVRAVVLTYGDSLLSVLEDAEIADITRVVVDQVGGRAVVVGAERSWWTGKAVEFARFCRECGVDILMVLPPDWTQSGTPETFADHYAQISEEIPVMLVTTYLRSRAVPVALKVIEETYRRVPGVLAVKEDVGGEFGRRMTAVVSPRWSVVAGGTKQLHTYLAPYGATGFLSTLAIFRPAVTRQYWRAFRGGDYPAMARIVRDVEMPMFGVLNGFVGGFDAALHGWCELAGIYPRWRRRPYRSLSDAELDLLRDSLHRIALLDPS
jgi:4-hydroxy-tetrahydrodipicolinate synthase